MREPALNQKTRFVLLLLELVILCAASWIAFGRMFPASDDKGFWFYTALLGLLLGSRLDTPFFAKPADVVLYAAPAAIALALGNSWAQWSEGVQVAYCAAMAFCILAGMLGGAAILTVDSKTESWQRTSNAARVLAETLGAPRTIYSVVIAFALFAFHSSSPKELGIIGTAWVLTGVLSPIPALRDAFQKDLIEFLATTNTRRLKIYNPSQVVGSKQLSEPKQFQTRGQWQRGAALWGITPVEVTRIVSETVLTLLQDKMSTKARVCLVYEEAHSLVPEFSSVASPSDREASNGTARAILQGRKFGLGCLVVTQRTANVTKTILNQCNTVFAMRTFDETGKEFLANYIGKEYAASLSSISERHAVLFGKASSCENPILIRLNDQNAFRQAFRSENPPPTRPENNAPAPTTLVSAPLASPVDDDVPF